MIARKLRARSDFKTLPTSFKLKHKKRHRAKVHHQKPPGSDSDYDSGSDGMDSEDESQKDYRRGGYHPVKIGEVYKQRYVIEKKLGFGYFSTVWLASDNQAAVGDPHKLVAIKFQKSANHYREAAEDEIKILSQIHGQSSPLKEFVVRLLDKFAIQGPNGKHICMVFEVMWKDLLFLMKKFGHHGLPVSLVKMISYQVLSGLELIHGKCQIIHTDLKPENFLMTLPAQIDVSDIQKDRAQYMKSKDVTDLKSDIGRMKSMKLSKNQRRRLKDKIKRFRQVSGPEQQQIEETLENREALTKMKEPDYTKLEHKFIVKIADLGNGCWVDKHFTDDVATRQYRPPEVIMGYPYDTSLDIFSAATMIYELATGDYLFNPEREDSTVRNEKHLSLMVQVMGPLPRKLIRAGKYAKSYMSRDGTFRNIRTPEPVSLESMLEKRHFPAKEIPGFAQFLRGMLNMNPDHRLTAARAKLDPWLNEVHQGYVKYGAKSFQFPNLDEEVDKFYDDRDFTDSESDSDYREEKTRSADPNPRPVAVTASASSLPLPLPSASTPPSRISPTPTPTPSLPSLPSIIPQVPAKAPPNTTQ